MGIWGLIFITKTALLNVIYCIWFSVIKSGHCIFQTLIGMLKDVLENWNYRPSCNIFVIFINVNDYYLALILPYTLFFSSSLRPVIIIFLLSLWLLFRYLLEFFCFNFENYGGKKYKWKLIYSTPMFDSC